jgi:hypothetical protein
MSARNQNQSVKSKIGGLYRLRRDAARTNRALDATWKLIVLVIGMTLLG